MDKLNEIKSKLHLLSDEQLDIIHRLISTWKIEDNKIQTDENLVKKIYESTISPIEDPLKNYSKEELLEEYGVLFYNPSCSSCFNCFVNVAWVIVPSDLCNSLNLTLLSSRR